MAINFPLNPTSGQIHQVGNSQWQFNGVAWDVVSNSSPSFTSVTTGTLTTTGTSNLYNLNVTGNLTFGNGTITGVDLNDLSNVTAPAPADGDALVWNESNSRWEPGEVAGGSGGFNGGTISNPLIIDNDGATTSASSGALRITGGVGIGDDLYVEDNVTVNGTLFIKSEAVQVQNGNEIQLYNTANAKYVGFKAPDTLSNNKIYVLLTADGVSGQYLRTNGSGVLSWASVTSPSGGTPPGGVPGQVQYNDALEFGGDSGFTYDSASQTMGIVNIDAGSVTISSTSDASNITSGALQVVGGVGIGKNLHVGGSIFSDADTASTSTTTGSIVVTGGMGVSGEMHIGSTVSASTAPSSNEHLANKEYVDATAVAFAVAFGA